MPKTITHEQLVRRAREAFERAGLRQVEIARRIGAPESSVSRALSSDAGAYDHARLAILRELRGEDWQPETVFRRVKDRA